MSRDLSPRGAHRLLRRLLPESYGDDVAADLEREYQRKRARGWGRRRAGFWYWRQVLAPDTLRLARLLRARERTKEYKGGVGMMMESLVKDLGFAVRGLFRNPLYSVVAVVTLALGIGANTAVFSVVKSVLLEPLPYPEAERLVSLMVTDRDEGVADDPWSLQSLRDVVDENTSFQSIAGYSWKNVTLTGLGEPERFYAVAVTEGLLETFGKAPALGRDLRPEESIAGGPLVVVVSEAFWRDRLGGDASVLGRTLELSGRSYEIVGVAPEGFDFPQQDQIWIPGQWDEEAYPRGRSFLRAVGRLAPGATLAGAQEELTGIAARLEEEYPETNRARGVYLMSLMDYTVGHVRVGLTLLMGAVGMVLLIACANVANLLLVRGSARAGEMAVRTTLGASRGALTRLLTSESLVLSLAGGTLGVLLAVWGVQGLVAWSPGGIPRLDEVSIDGGVLLFAATLALAVTLLFGLAPALRLAHTPIAVLVREGRDGSATTRGRRFARSGLLTVEVALSLVLLLGAGLLLRSFSQIRAIDIGVDVEGVQQFTLTLPQAEYDSEEAVAFFRTLGSRLEAMQGVAAVGMINGSPLGRSHTSMGFDIMGRPQAEPGNLPSWLVRFVTPGYFESLRVPLLRGRRIEPTDGPESPTVAVISHTAADRYWPGEDPLGERFSFDSGETMWTVVGVVGDVRSLELTEVAEPEAYFPHAQWSRNSMTVVLRLADGLPALGPELRQEVAALDPDLPLYWMEMLEDRLDVFTASDRFYLYLLGLFAALAVVLASVGLYGVVAYRVSSRTREIGIRVALGADRSDVVRLVVGQGIRPVTAGIVIGIIGALSGGRVLASLLYQVEPWDPITFGAGASLLFAVALLATFLPVRAASRISPTQAMRVE